MRLVERYRKTLSSPIADKKGHPLSGLLATLVEFCKRRTEQCGPLRTVSQKPVFAAIAAASANILPPFAY